MNRCIKEEGYNMNYELYDILTIDDLDYVIASTVLKDKNQYFLLIEANEKEDLQLNNIKVMKQTVFNNVDPELLYPIVDEKEFIEAEKLLREAMKDNLQDIN